MKIISSHKILFLKIAAAGLVMTVLSGLFLAVMNSTDARRRQEMIRREGATYAESLVQMADLLSGDLMRDATVLYEWNLNDGKSPAEAIVLGCQELSAKGFDRSLIWYLDPQGGIHSYLRRSDDIEFVNEFHKLRSNNRQGGFVIYQGRLYLLTYSETRVRGSVESKAWLLVALPADVLFAAVDREHRMAGIEPIKAGLETSAAGANPSLIINALRTHDGDIIGFLRIKARPGGIGDLSTPGWESAILWFLPILSLLVFALIVYRYFESFGAQSEALSRILKREKPGVEIFRRDHKVMKNRMPELADLFGLLEENLKDKARFQKSLDIVSASLSVIGEKGYDQSAINEILRLIANSTSSHGAALFLVNPSDELAEICGRHNFTDDLVITLTQTPQGIAFLKFSQKQSSGLHVTDINTTPAGDPLRKIFGSCRYVITMPLRFKAQDTGVLVILSLELDPIDPPSNYLPELTGDLLAALAYGTATERERSSRSDKTRILQETSLAISSTLDLPSVLKVVAGRLTDYAGAAYCLILLNTDTENVMDVACFYTKRQGSVAAPEATRICLAEFPRLVEAIANKKALVLGLEDFSEFTSAEKSFFRTDLIKRLTVLPISHSGKSTGSVILGEERSRSRAAMPPEKLNFVQAIVSQAASAIENARLYGFINQKVDQLTTLYNVSAVIHSEIDVDLMIDKVLQATKEYLHYSTAALFTFDEKAGRLTPMGACDPDRSRTSGRVANPDRDCIAALVASTGESVVVDDLRVETNLKPTFPSTISELAVPVRIGSKIIGVFSIGSHRKSAFSQVEESFLKALSAQIAVAVERARLFDQERERGLRLKTIFDFSSRVSKSLNLQEVLRIATESIQEAFGYHLVAIFLVDQIHQEFYVGHQSSATEKELPPDFTVELTMGLLGRAASSGKTLYCPDVSREPHYVLAVSDVKSEVCIPIIVADKVIGVLDVESMMHDDFAPEDINTLEALADIMAVAIDNSYLFEETVEKAERLALIDNINKAISATLDLDSFFKVVAKAVADNAGYRWTLLVVPEGESFVFKAGYTPKSVGVISPEPILHLLQDKLRSVIEFARPGFMSFPELAAMGKPERLQAIVDAGIRNLALFPIGDSARADAVMIVGSSRADAFSLQELSLLKDLAVHLRIAWQNAQLYKQLKTAFEQLQEAQDRVVQTEKLRALGEMSSGVVHDFNNILAAILGRTQIMLRKMIGAEDHPPHEFLQKNLELIEKAATDGSQILSRISEFTKKQPSGKFADLHLDQIISDVIELTKPRWHDQALESGKKIDMEFHRTGDLQTTGNAAELREVFTNLVINAVDAIVGEGKIAIDARLEPNDVITVIVADDGCGMSEETLKRIFEPFFTTKGARGTGLGLSVTYAILSRHKGSIEAESELGVGTRFSITIPVRKHLLAESSSEASPGSKAGRRRILVVDDETEFREVLVEILMSGGHSADSASGGGEALEILRQNTYDIVITDLGMLDFSGWDLADAIYRERPDVKVIMATGWGAQLEPGNLALHHVNSLICKPFKINEILDAVDRVMSCSRDEVLVGQV